MGDQFGEQRPQRRGGETSVKPFRNVARLTCGLRLSLADPTVHGLLTLTFTW